MTVIYKILRAQEWVELENNGVSDGAPIDIADGFIHFSGKDTVEKTAELYFSGADGLMLLAYNAEGFGDALKWEASRGGALFPHLFAQLPLVPALWAKPLPLKNGAHDFEGLL